MALPLKQAVMIYAHVVPAINLKNAVTIINGYVLPMITEMHSISITYTLISFKSLFDARYTL